MKATYHVTITLGILPQTITERVLQLPTEAIDDYVYFKEWGHTRADSLRLAGYLAHWWLQPIEKEGAL